MGLDDGVLGVVGRGGRGETAELFVLGREMEAQIGKRWLCDIHGETYE